MNDEDRPLPILIFLLTMMGMVATGLDQELPPNESFSCDNDSHCKHRSKSSSCKDLENDIMSRALNQISRSPFTCRIEGGRLPRRFTQLTFTMYNGRTDPIKHVCHFNQRMAMHSKN